MLRRLLFFTLGILISIVFLSIGPDNRLKNTFYAYIDYFNMDKRVITHLYNSDTQYSITAQCQLVYYDMEKSDLLLVLDNGSVNFDLSINNGENCQYYVIENTVGDNSLSVTFEYCYKENTVQVMNFRVNNDPEVCKF